MSFLRNLRDTARVANATAARLEGNPYFASYVQNATNQVALIPQVSNVPTDVPLETLVALATYRPVVIQNGIAQNRPQNLPDIQAAMRERLQSSGRTITNLSNFRPSILPNGVIQQRPSSLAGQIDNALRNNANYRNRVLAGLDSATRQLVANLEDLQRLQKLQRDLNLITQILEQQIARFTGIFNALINLPDAAISAALTTVINKLDTLERAYTAAKNLLALIIKTAANIKKAIQKALFTDIPNAARRLRTGLDALTKILKLPELKLRLRFPKRPKKRRTNFTKLDFYQKFKKALTALKNKNGTFYQKAYDTAIQQSGIEIVDPKKDKIQQGLTKARNALREARAQFEAQQAVRTAAVERARNQLINNVRKLQNTTERERDRIINQSTNMVKRAGRVAARAAARAANLAARRQYLTPEEIRTIRASNRVDDGRTNVLGDRFFTGLAGTVIFTLPDGKSVYTDRRTNKLYVLQSLEQRVNELASTTTNALRANTSEFNAAVQTVKTAVASAAEMKNLLNNNTLKAEFTTNLIQQAQTVSSITQQTNASIAAEKEAQTATNETSAVADANIVFTQNEFSIDATTKTVTTTTRRLSAAQAVNQATTYNRDIAERNGYTIPLTIRPTGPRSVQVNGQTVYELILAIEYKNFNEFNQARFEQLGQRQSATTITIPSTLGAPITSVPQAVLNAAQSGPPISDIDRLRSATTVQTFTTPSSLGAPITSTPRSVQETALNSTLLPADRQEVERLTNQINQIERKLSQGINDDGTSISGEDRAALRAQQVALRDEITRIRNGRLSVPGSNIPDNLLEPITPNIPIAQERLPADTVQQLGAIITVIISRTTSLNEAINQARTISRNKASQSNLPGTPRVDIQFTERTGITGRTIYTVTLVADYTRNTQSTQEGDRVTRQLNVNTLLDQGISIAEINARYSPPGPVDENGNVI